MAGAGDGVEGRGDVLDGIADGSCASDFGFDEHLAADRYGGCLLNVASREGPYRWLQREN